MNRPPLLLTVCTLLGLVGCASPVKYQARAGATHRIDRAAVAPAGGVVADTIATALARHGIPALDRAATANLLGRLHVDVAKATLPTNLTRLRAEGIDDYVTADASLARIGDYPVDLAVTAVSTHDGRTIAELTWHDPWGGTINSADAAGRDIGKALAELFRPAP
jgi:hypothetical protein